MGIIEALVDCFSRVQDEQLKKTELKAPEIPETLTPTERKLAGMFMEHIPTCILDSGDAFGYAYQRNRAEPVWLRPDARFEFCIRDGKVDIVPYVNTYKDLANQLIYDEDVDAKFQEWRKQKFEDGESWEEHLKEFVHPKTGKTYSHWLSEYTYNIENPFDQNFIWYMISPDYHYICNDNVVILQIHNGCDARGGFTEPVMFLSYDFYPYQELVYMHCSKCDAWWDVNPYGHTEHCGSDDYKGLEEYPCEKGIEGKVGVVVVSSEDKAFCPVCGKGHFVC